MVAESKQASAFDARYPRNFDSYAHILFNDKPRKSGPSHTLTELRIFRKNPLDIAFGDNMARSQYSPSPSPSLPSSGGISDSSTDEEFGLYGEAGEYGASASRPGSPAPAEAVMAGDDQEADTMTCQWEDCGKVFNHLPTLIDHIHGGE